MSEPADKTFLQIIEQLRDSAPIIGVDDTTSPDLAFERGYEAGFRDGWDAAVEHLGDDDDDTNPPPQAA
ncbi:MAG: hypothetical protein RIB46_01245 [Pseudomonadales bacterium]